MSAEITAVITFGLLIAAIVAGMQLSEERLSKSTKDTVKLATGLVATMSALVLGLLVSSAKNSYDTVRSEVIDVSSKIVFLDRLLIGYGPEAADARVRLREWVEEATNRMWPSESWRTADLTPNSQEAKTLYLTIQNLPANNDLQRAVKAEATQVMLEVGKIRSLLVTQSVPSVSKLMLAVVISWLVIIFFSFSMLAPTNAPAIISLVVSALSACGALSLILELDQPFGGLIGISSEPMRNALAQLAK